ncbi:MAG TPA: M17 family metallopeptidase, partial [Phenylobacterium sp.]|nr:M17 family metallopeptidase [Phenylobacterium sp.]
AAAECLRKNIISASVMMPSIPRPGEREVLSALAEGFCLGDYGFTRYKTKKENGDARFGEVIFRSDSEGAGDLLREAEIVCRNTNACRDLVNESSDNCTPALFAAAAKKLAKQRGISCTVFGEADIARMKMGLLQAVSRGSANPPRLVVLKYRGGTASSKSVALVGKGVVFDTGGLDIKPAAGMRLMKKDMGGAAHALALGRMIMAARLPVRLAVLVPAVENAISGDAMRPGDVLASRQGLSIEVGNTDAEGRLILADALTRAAELEPALTLDMATLTGAARVALGPQLPPFFTDDEDLAREIEAAAQAAHDPVWRLPLWKGYVDALDSDIADIKNDPDGWAQAGAMTAGLFLQRFAPPGPWAHFDIFAWNPRGRPGWPSGGEAQAIRGLYCMIRTRFA